MLYDNGWQGVINGVFSQKQYVDLVVKPVMEAYKPIIENKINSSDRTY